MSSGASVSTGGGTIKTIVIGVVTTVLGAAAVYFLGFHEKKENPKKEATENAVKSIIQYEQILEKSITTFACSKDDSYAQGLFLKEIEQLQKSMLNIKSEKDIDNRVLSLIDRRVNTLDELKSSAEELFNSTNELRNTGMLPTEAIINKSNELENEFNNKMALLSEQEKPFRTDIMAALKKDYDLDFEIKSLQLKPSETNITGKWLINQFVKWNILADHTFTWAFDDKEFDGTWSLKEDVIHLQFSHPEEADLRIVRLYDNFMACENTKDKTASEACRQ